VLGGDYGVRLWRVEPFFGKVDVAFTVVCDVKLVAKIFDGFVQPLVERNL
jgi:hypothetical protein